MALNIVRAQIRQISSLLRDAERGTDGDQTARGETQKLNKVEEDSSRKKVKSRKQSFGPSRRQHKRQRRYKLSERNKFLARESLSRGREQTVEALHALRAADLEKEYERKRQLKALRYLSKNPPPSSELLERLKKRRR